MRNIYILFLLLFLSLSGQAQPKHEVRAVWLATIGGIDWPHSYANDEATIEKQKNELRQTLDLLQLANINTVLLQTRIRGTVIYPSAYEPWDGCLSGVPGKSPGYDALQFAIDECHRRGMELHAWIVTIPVGKWNALGCRRLRKKMPRGIKKIGADGYMNPETKQTADYLADICDEVTRGYDIDGIHLDYIRYPETWTLKVSRSQGRANITAIVRAITRRVKALKPWVKMSCSPIGKHDDLTRYPSRGWNAYTTVCQDAQGWLRDGLMDALFPMMYFRDNNFYPFALDWKEQSHGRIIAPGLGIYFLSPKEKDWPLTDITRELNVLRAEGMGHAYFRSKFFTDDTKGIYAFAREQYCQYPALIPPMTWQNSAPPRSPQGLTVQKGKDGLTRLSWSHEEEDTTMMSFNIYVSTSFPVNTNDARNLIATRRQGRSIVIPCPSPLHFAVTATDRYGNESQPLQESYETASLIMTAAEQEKASLPLLSCDGKHVTVPSTVRLTDAKHLVVTTLQGSVVATIPLPYSSNTPTTTADISALAEGMYALRTLEKKGVSHRIGMFLVKRK